MADRYAGQDDGIAAFVPRINVCRGKSCTPGGGVSLLRDLEELCENEAEVECCDCLGLCGLGPNVEVIKNGEEPLKVQGNRTFDLVEQLVTRHVRTIGPLQRQFGRLKFAARREPKPEVRRAKLEQALALLGGEGAAAGRQPRFFAELLAIRAQESLRGAWGNAVADAQMATELSPNSAAARRQFAEALEAAGRVNEAVAQLRQGLVLGRSIDREAASAHLRRLEAGRDRSASAMVERRAREQPLSTVGKMKLEEADKKSSLFVVELPDWFARFCTARAAREDEDGDSEPERVL